MVNSASCSLNETVSCVDFCAAIRICYICKSTSDGLLYIPSSGSRRPNKSKKVLSIRRGRAW